MKTAFATLTFRFFPVLWFTIACLGFAPVARAGFTLEMDLIRYDQNGYYSSPT